MPIEGSTKMLVYSKKMDKFTTDGVYYSVGVCTAHKNDLHYGASELVYSTILHLPAKFFYNSSSNTRDQVTIPERWTNSLPMVFITVWMYVWRIRMIFIAVHQNWYTALLCTFLLNSSTTAAATPEIKLLM